MILKVRCMESSSTPISSPTAFKADVPTQGNCCRTLVGLLLFVLFGTPLETTGLEGALLGTVAKAFRYGSLVIYVNYIGIYIYIYIYTLYTNDAER